MSATAPRISIIVAAYNAADLIGRCIDSCLAQTYPDFELIIIDDGSTDATIDIVQTYQQQEPRLRCYRVENGGQGKARNIALGQATGDYVTILDADDALHTTALARLVQVADTTGADLIAGEWETRDIGTGARKYTPLFAGLGPDATPDAIKTRLIRNTYYSVAKLYRRSLLDTHQIRYGEGYIYEDMEFLVGAVLQAETLQTLSGPLYTVYATGTTSTKTRTGNDWHARSFTQAVQATTTRYADALQPYARDYVHYVLNRVYFYTARQHRIPRTLWRPFTRDIFACLTGLFAGPPTRQSAGLIFSLPHQLGQIHPGVGYLAFGLIIRASKARAFCRRMLQRVF